jgi:hypothetical protein
MPDRWRPSGSRGTRDGLGRGSPRGAREERDNSVTPERSQMPVRPTLERTRHQPFASSAELRQKSDFTEPTMRRDVVLIGGVHCLDDERLSRRKPPKVCSGLSRDHRPRCQPPPVMPLDVPAPPRSITVRAEAGRRARSLGLSCGHPDARTRSCRSRRNRPELQELDPAGQGERTWN